MFLILVECLSAWQNHEVTAAQRSIGGGGGGSYHYGGGSLQNSLHHHKGQLYNLNSHHHHHLNSASVLRSSKIDNTFTSKSKSTQ